MAAMMSNFSTTLGLSKDPQAYEQRALVYESKGKMAKAQKNREKAARLRQNQITNPANPTSASQGGMQGFLAKTPLGALRNPERYDQKALKWQNKGNQVKAQKNRDKAARLRAEQANRGIGAPLAASTAPLSGTPLGLNSAPLNMGAAPLGAPLGGNQFNSAPLGAAPLGGAQYASSTLPATTHSHLAPAVVETHTRPTVIEQTSRPEKIVEVQPIVHRDIDAPQVHIVEKHSYQAVPLAGPHVINKAPIVEETIRPRVIEEVQPVVHREVPAPFVQRVEQHVTEHITKPTVVTKDVLNNAPLPGVAAGGIPPTSAAPINPLNNQARRL